LAPSNDCYRGGRIVDRNAISLQAKENDYGESNGTLTKKPKKAFRFQRGDEFGAGAKQRVAPLTLRPPDHRIPGPRRSMIVGDVSKKSYFASTTSPVSEQPIAK
jgi:hypothetical protein